MRARWGTRTFGLMVVGGLITAVAAVAATVPIAGTKLHSNHGAAVWDPYNSGIAYCMSNTAPVYTPVADGKITSPRTASDAFDYGLNLFLAADNLPLVAFVDPDDNGNRKAQTLRVGPTNLAGLQVSRTDSGLPGSPTLRDLIKLRNPNAGAFNGKLVLDTNLGSDGSTVVIKTSSGDTTVTTGDRWTVTADALTQPGDPPVTIVYYGKGAVRSKPTQLIHTPGNTSDCATTQFHVRVPGHSTRYMLIFAEMHSSNNGAVASTDKFNNKHLSSALLKGISSSVQKDILNWDLG
jgi:hypothetical protein